MSAFKQEYHKPDSDIIANALVWLDEVITITLNPANTDMRTITRAQATLLMTKVDKEFNHLMPLIQSQLLSANNRGELKQLVRIYHPALIFLANCETENVKHSIFEKDFLQSLHLKIASCLETMVAFIETRYGNYLSLKERAPVSYFSLMKTTLSKRIKKIERHLAAQADDWPLPGLLCRALDDFMNAQPETRNITYRDMLYVKALVGELAQLEMPQSVMNTYTALDGLLVSLNFNHRPYLDYFTQRLSGYVDAATGLAEKLDLLLHYYKSFKQLYRKPGVAFNPKNKSVDSVICNWFRQEIRYLKQKRRLSGSASQIKKESVVKPKQAYSRQKITCHLSTDQMALILRSLDDLRIISARSLNDVFRNIVPHLSTPHKQELSFEAMRSKSYVVETKDQQKVMETLQEMLEKIKKY